MAIISFDALKRLIQFNYACFGITKFFYNAASRLTCTVTQYEYTVKDFLRKVSHYKSDGTLLAGWVREAFDNVGQVLRERELHQNRYTDFFYNDAYELTRYTVRRIVGAIDARGSYIDDQALLDESFTYDSVGNRIRKRDNITGQTINYIYDAFNKLIQAGNEQFTYDGNGNLIRRTIGQEVWEYEWNDLDELVKIVRPDGQIVRFTYDGLGRRVKKEGPSGTFTYLHDGFQVLSDGVVEYGWAGSRLIAERWTTGTAPKFWHLTDGRASTRLLTDANQQVVATLDYKAFGELWQSSGNVPTTRRFVSYGGYEYKLETGLYHICYRYYDPEIGRFLSIDPIGFGVNWYVYALSDPINLFEWFGLEPTTFDDRPDAFVDDYIGKVKTVRSNFIGAVWDRRSLERINQAYRDRLVYQWSEPPGWILGKGVITQFAANYALMGASRVIAALPAPRSFPMLPASRSFPILTRSSGISAEEEQAIIRTIRDILTVRGGRRPPWLRRGHWGDNFRNREGLPGTNHRVYDVYRPPGAPRGPRRIIINDQGEWFYTPDHYHTFYRIPPELIQAIATNIIRAW